MKVNDAASYLSTHGYPCSVGTIRALAKAGKIRHRRVGVTGRGRIEFTEAQLDAFLKAAEIGGPDAPTLTPERKPRLKPTVTTASLPRPTIKVGSGVAPDWQAMLSREKGL